jgi:hypothetical protein
LRDDAVPPPVCGARGDLPPDHPARRVGDLGDYLILTEDDELIEE